MKICMREVKYFKQTTPRVKKPKISLYTKFYGNQSTFFSAPRNTFYPKGSATQEVKICYKYKN